MKHNNTFTFIVIVIVIVIALFALYKSTSAPDINAPIDVVITENIETKNWYIWLTLEQADLYAQEQGNDFRVINIDGEKLSATMDYVVGRINATLVNGIITEYYVEGNK
jgi:hypothetical protein